MKILAEIFVFCVLMLYIAFGYWYNRMRITQQILGKNIALCSGRKTESSREIAHTLYHRPDIGFLMYPTQPVIISTGKQRTNRVRNLETINKSMQRLKLVDMVGDK